MSADLGLVVELDREEAGVLGPADQVALVEVEHRIGFWLDLSEDLLDPLREVGDPVARIAPETLPPLVHAEAVDRLEQRDSTARHEHAEELGEGALLATDVDQHRTGRDDVDARVRDAREVVRGRFDEAAPVRKTERARGLAAEIEQVVGNVREDHVAGAAIERAEADQSLPAADVEEPLARSDARPVEDLV